MKRRDTGLRDDNGVRIREGDSVLEYTYDSSPDAPSGMGWERYTVRYGTYRQPYTKTDRTGFYRDYGSFHLPFGQTTDPRLLDL